MCTQILSSFSLCVNRFLVVIAATATAIAAAAADVNIVVCS